MHDPSQSSPSPAADADWPDETALIDLPVDCFELSQDAIQAVLDSEGEGFCQVDIDILTAIAVATGAVRCIVHRYHESHAIGAPCELRRMRTFRIDEGTLVPVRNALVPAGVN
jgi:hypothetical protein